MMREVLRYQFSGLRRAWDGGLRGEYKRSAIAFLILCVLSFALCMALPALREQLISLTVSTVEGLHVTQENGSLSALALFSNNLRSCAFIMLYGFIPFVLLPALSLGINAMLLGVLAAWYVTEGVSLAAYLAALLPHGVFEFPALFSAFAMGLYVCGQVSRRCRGNKDALPLWDCLVLSSRALLLVQLPLLAVSSFIEAYVTPVIASQFF